MLFIRPTQSTGRNWSGRSVLTYEDRNNNVERAVEIIEQSLPNSSLDSLRNLLKRLNRFLVKTDSISASVIGEIVASRRGCGFTPYVQSGDSAWRLWNSVKEQ